MKRMYRYEVPVDDQAHPFMLNGDPLAVAVKQVGMFNFVVEFWAEANGTPSCERHFQVYGTGHQLPDTATWRGTCPRTPAGLVWHLYEVSAS